ncbi:PREDICTED: DNA excision repair protein ERCC-6-like [Calidris pugnax]|nr:PREDICTED: DNA excision repair protein ERCC-6-like [Calidris pugnax]
MAGPGGEEEEERYRRLVSDAKAAAGDGELEEALRLFRQAAAIRPSEKLQGRIQRVAEALAAAAAEEDEAEEEGFVNVCGSGLLLYGEVHEKLFQHQREGVAFLYRLHREGRPGGILADDMGLGKTVQVIAFLSGMFDGELLRHVLLVVPTTLVSTWLAEFARWTPGVRVKEFYGTSKTERTRNLEKVQRRNGVVITTYQMLINNWKQLASSNEQEFVWDYIILDEAHKIKSPSTKTTKSVHAIPAKHRLLLTGTPVQNNLREMWSLFDFACQGTLLGTAKTFRMEYENPITRAREKDATLGEKALGLKISENLMTIIKPYFLRRTKEDIKNKPGKPDAPLPEDPSENRAPVMPSLTRKNDFVVWVYLAPVQEEIYRNFLSLDHVKEVLLTTRSPLAELTVLKKLCDHPRILSARACVQLGLEEQEYSEEDRGSDADPLPGANKIDHLSDETLIQESGKMTFLIGLLERLREEGHQTLVFSQSRKMLDIIEHVLSRRQFKIMRIDGTVTHLTEREKRVNAFQSNKHYSVFLLTTQVGGVGLTLTAASRVVIFDPSWNPATDAQAVDRAYRIGQKENVVIYRLVTCGTVEEKIYRRQIFKDSLIRQSTGDKKNPFRYFSKQELRELFTLEDTRTSATQLQLQSLHATQRKTDLQLDEHIAYLHSLEMFGISDHDLIHTREMAHEEQVESEEAHRYIQQRVQKAHELVQLESQLRDQRMGGIRNACEETLQRPPEWVSQPKKLSPGLNNMARFDSPPVADKSENDQVIDLTEDREAQILNVSSKMTSLTIGDLDEEKLEQNVSCMDTEQLNTSNTVKQSNTEESKQNLESSIIPSSPGLHPPHKESESLEQKQCSPVNSDTGTEAGNGLSRHHWHSFNESGMADKPKRLRDAEMSDQVPDPRTALGTENDIPELSLAAAVPNLSNVTPEFHGRHQKSHVLEANFEDTSVLSPQDQVDFNLVLEESEDGCQDASNRERSLEHPEKEGFQLEAESFCKSPTKAWVSEQGDCGEPCHAAEKPLLLLQESEASEENSGVFASSRKKNPRRIVSDSEDEDHSVMIMEQNQSDKRSSPLTSPLQQFLEGMSTSTPKGERRVAMTGFSPQLTNNGKGSTASRRSLIYKVVDEVEDIGEIMGTTDEEDDEDSDEEQDDLVEEEAEECSGESAEPEEEPAGETLDTAEESFHVESMASEQSEADETESSQEESAGDAELQSGEQVDCFTQESVSDKEVAQGSSPAAGDYNSLVDSGKKLKDAGKLQEALNCFLQALDIKNGDPEVMLMTLNLYRQLAQK